MPAQREKWVVIIIILFLEIFQIKDIIKTCCICVSPEDRGHVWTGQQKYSPLINDQLSSTEWRSRVRGQIRNVRSAMNSFSGRSNPARVASGVPV